MDIRKADSKGRLSGFTPGGWYRKFGGMNNKYSLEELEPVDEVPEGMVDAEEADRQNAIQDAITAFEIQTDTKVEDVVGLGAYLSRQFGR
jgi:hypothetical protein